MRPGLTLVELLVAVTLFTLLTAIALPTSARLIRVQDHLHADGARLAALDDALTSLQQQVRGTDAASGHLLVAHDTVLEVRAPIGIAVVCLARADTLWVARGDSAHPWAPQLRRDVGAGDQALLMMDSLSPVMRDVRATAGGGTRCGDADHPWTGVASQRLLLDSVVAVVPGTPVRVLARERWTLQRSGDGSWSLAFATWDAARGGYVVAQPVMGPLAPPSDPHGPGLTVRALAADGAVLRDTLQRARQVLVVLRARRDATRRTLADSVLIDVAAP